MPTISVIIPAYNASKTICKTLEAIISQEQLEHIPEIIVVDDGSIDNTSELAQKYNEVITVAQNNAGPAAARNRGVQHSTGEIIVFTDSDTVPHKNWLYELVKPFENANICATTGTYSIENHESRLSQFIQAEIVGKHSKYNDFVLFGGSYNFAIRKTLFQKIGGFNEEYKRASGEDTEICYKILTEGHRIKYVPTAIVGHFHPEKLSKYLKTQFTHGYWRAKLYYSFPQRTTGDSYTSSKELFETIFCISTIFSPLFALSFKKVGCKRFVRLFQMTMLVSTLGIIGTELNSAISIKNTASRNCLNKLPAFYSTIFILLSRAFYRTFGLLSGIVKFFPEIAKRISHK